MERGSYSILEVLSTEGSPLVAKAQGPVDSDVVVLKELPHPPSETRLQSLDLLQNTRCPNLRVPSRIVHDEKGWYSTARWLPGPSLETARRQRFQGKVPVRQALLWLRHALLALEVLHYHGLLHGDLKPSNLLLDDSDQAVLVDLEGLQALKDDKIEFATPEYLIPDHSAQGTVARDLYAAAFTFAALVTGQVPEHAEEPTRLSHLDPLLPEVADPLFLRALGGKDRFESATEMLAEVDKLLGKEAQPAAGSTSPPTRRVAVPDSEQGSKWIRTALAVSVLCFALGAGLSLAFKPSPVGPPPTLVERTGVEAVEATLPDHEGKVWETLVLGRPVACFAGPDQAYGGETAADRARWAAGVLQQVSLQKRSLKFEYRAEAPEQSEVWLTQKDGDDLFLMRVTKSECDLFDQPAPALARLWTRLIDDTFTLLGFAARPGQAEGVLLLRPWRSRAETLGNSEELSPEQKIANLREAFSSLKPDLQHDILESFRPKKEKKKG